MIVPEDFEAQLNNGQTGVMRVLEIQKLPPWDDLWFCQLQTSNKLWAVRKRWSVKKGARAVSPITDRRARKGMQVI